MVYKPDNAKMSVVGGDCYKTDLVLFTKVYVSNIRLEIF